jgi:hypothetical protein
MQKQIQFEKGILIIGYYENTQDISIYESEEYTEPITLTFFPNIGMTQNACLEYTNENMTEIISETKMIISENNEFYKNFTIDLNSEFLGYTLHRNVLDRNLLIVSESWMRLKSELKKNKFSQNN